MAGQFNSSPKNDCQTLAGPIFSTETTVVTFLDLLCTEQSVARLHGAKQHNVDILVKAVGSIKALL